MHNVFSIVDIAATGSGSGGSSLSGVEKLAKESLDLESEVLTALDKKFRDNSGASTSGDTGPIYDIIRYLRFMHKIGFTSDIN